MIATIMYWQYWFPLCGGASAQGIEKYMHRMYGGPIGVPSDLDPTAETIRGNCLRIALQDIGKQLTSDLSRKLPSAFGTQRPAPPHTAAALINVLDL